MIKLIESTHTYINDVFPECKYTSITTILGKYHKPYDSDFFAEKVALREGVTKEEILERWDQIKNEANEYGTELHAILERYLKSPKKLYSPRDDFERKVISAFKMCCDINGLNIVQNNNIKSEHIMSIEFNDNKGIAGTSDIIEDVDNKTFNIWDFKTNKRFEYDSKYNNWLHFPVDHLTHCQYNEYALQIAIYGVMYERETGKKFNRGGLFHWDRNECTFTLIPINFLKRDAENIIDHYKMRLLSE